MKPVLVFFMSLKTVHKVLSPEITKENFKKNFSRLAPHYRAVITSHEENTSSFTEAKTAFPASKVHVNKTFLDLKIAQ